MGSMRELTLLSTNKLRDEPSFCQGEWEFGHASLVSKRHQPATRLLFLTPTRRLFFLTLGQGSFHGVRARIVVLVGVSLLKQNDFGAMNLEIVGHGSMFPILSRNLDFVGGTPRRCPWNVGSCERSDGFGGSASECRVDWLQAFDSTTCILCPAQVLSNIWAQWGIVLAPLIQFGLSYFPVASVQKNQLS